MKVFRTLLGMTALALMATSCLKGTYTSQLTAAETFEYQNFLTAYPDSTHAGSYFYGTSGYVLFNSYYDNDNDIFYGGFALSSKKDNALGVRSETCNEWCALNTNASLTTSTFGVYQVGTVADKQPDHAIYFLGNSNATWNPESVYITNTGYVANLIAYGSDEIEPFKEGDYLKVIFTPYINDKAQTPVEKTLAEYRGSLDVIKEWTQVEFGSVQGVGYIDITFETNRDDIPLYVCLDGLVGTVNETSGD